MMIMKRKLIIILLFIITASSGYYLAMKKIKIIIVPITEEIFFSDKYITNAKLSIPAAYTNEDGSIQGEYRINGKTYGTPSRKERVSIHPVKGLVVSSQWHSDNGFQQTVLVKKGKARVYNDSKRRMRRALCNETSDSRSLMIIQSTYPMTLTEFAQELQHYCYTAVNLDTGDYGYGRYKNHRLHWWAFFNKHRQTNWIYCE